MHDRILTGRKRERKGGRAAWQILTMTVGEVHDWIWTRAERERELHDRIWAGHLKEVLLTDILLCMTVHDVALALI